MKVGLFFSLERKSQFGKKGAGPWSLTHTKTTVQTATSWEHAEFQGGER